MIDRLTPIEDLNLSCRAYNCLKRAGIDTLGEIADLTMDKLLHIRNLGQRAAEEIVDKLKAYGLNLQGETGGLSYTTEDLLMAIEEIDAHIVNGQAIDKKYAESYCQRLGAISEIIREKEKRDIVRCKDCKWRKDDGNCHGPFCETSGESFSVDENDYCSHGTRKEQPHD